MKRPCQLPVFTIALLCAFSYTALAQENSKFKKSYSITPSDPTLLEITPSGYHAEWSPNGSCVAFAAAPDGEIGIWIAPITGGQATQLNTTITGDCNISWKHDGSLLAFDSYPEPNSPLKVWTIKPDGSDIHLVTRNPRNGFGPSWSPDGSRIAMRMNGSGLDIYSCTPDGTYVQRHTTHPASDLHVDWSPDGLNLTFTSDRSGNNDIWIKPLSGGPARQITFHSGDDFRSCWSPDNQWLAFVSDRDGDKDIWVVSVEDGSLFQITDDPGYDTMPTWSPTGDRILYTSEQGFCIVDLEIATPVETRSFGSIRSEYLR